MGSIHAHETATGGRQYRIIYRRPDHTQTQERSFRTKRAAALRLAELELAKHRGDYVDPSEARITAGMVGAAWLESRAGDLKPFTLRTVQSASKSHVEPRWSDRQIGSIRHSEVQTWVASLAKTHSATTVRRCHELLAGVLEVAVRGRHLTRNVARDNWLPRKIGKERADLSHAQDAELAAIAKHPDLVVPFHLVTPHDLRHTAESLAISAGANVQAVQRMLGHATAAMTLDTYADLFDDDLDDVADALARAAGAFGVGGIFSPDHANPAAHLLP